MRRSGYAVIDAIVDRWARLESSPAWLATTSEETFSTGLPPEDGAPIDELIHELVDGVLPLATVNDHPRFFAFIPGSPTWASILGSFLSTGYNIFQGTWLDSAGPSRIELEVIDWFRQLIGYPDQGGGIFTSGGSAANLCAIVTARTAAGNPSNGTVYMSDQTHGSVERAAAIAGIQPSLLRLIPTSATPIADLRRTISKDRELGFRPLLLVANAGTTSTGTIDPINKMADAAKAEGLWLHVDAAYGGFAMLDEPSRPHFRGIERSDSVTIDPHKWLFQPYETGCLLVRDTAQLEDTFRMRTDYLQDCDWGPDHVNFCNRGLELSRSFRALRVWLSIRRYGLATHRAEIGRAIELARTAETYIRAQTQLELLSPASLGIVCFRFRDGPHGPELNDLNRKIQREITGSGYAMISSTRIRDCFSLRLCILNYRTKLTDVIGVVDRIVDIGIALQP